MNKEKMLKDLLKIIKHYGVMPQLKYFQSEIFELNEAIIKAESYVPSGKDNLDKVCNNSNYFVEHITEEIADVLVMLSQFVEYYKIQESDVYRIMNQKIDRQLERINENN